MNLPPNRGFASGSIRLFIPCVLPQHPQLLTTEASGAGLFLQFAFSICCVGMRGVGVCVCGGVNPGFDRVGVWVGGGNPVGTPEDFQPLASGFTRGQGSCSGPWIYSQVRQGAGLSPLDLFVARGRVRASPLDLLAGACPRLAPESGPGSYTCSLVRGRPSPLDPPV